MQYASLSYEDFVSVTDSTVVWTSAAEVPGFFKDLIFKERKKIDVYTPLEKGIDWLFELTRKHQPRTGNILVGGNIFAWYDLNGGEYSTAKLGLDLNNKVIVVGRSHHRRNPSDNEFNDFRFAKERYDSLPLSIREAYYCRFDGLDIPDSPAVGIYSRLLPFHIGRPWQSWDGYLEEFKGYRKKYLPWLEERIPGVLPARKSSPCTNFMMFLDSRPTLRGKEGDVLFVKNHIQDGVIYHIKDADIENIRILSEPAEAIDRYCEHVLLEKPGRFDFLPYTSEM
ncbi:hypothetical protein [Pseudomonas oryzihabitans]|uniref:hypothetical protein n=1 Tax=Pseudomonas oryzihabitans TaxID=47885 RepID=UPI002894651A|nr:hypothetical protein [Pseudomonas oryzihabitans]MDT3722302.1 hypothetical protein [Pseudomonas oryzihabitans]